MLKFELRKLTTAIMFLAVVGMLAACSGSSSTDDTLTYPGDNAMGTIRFDVDPAAATVTATPVGSPFTNNKLFGNGGGVIPNITITTTGAVWNGVDTIDFDVTIKNSDAARELSNVRIGVNSVTPGRDTSKLVNGDRCKNAAWSTCLPATDPAIVWVADNTTEGPVTKRVCSMLPTCTDSYLSVIHQGCGAVKSHWTLNTVAAAKYSFWSTLYADSTQTTDLLTDTRYDPYVPSVYVRTYKLSAATSSFPALGGASNSMAKGEWFYVSYGIDNPGNGSALSYPTSDAVNNVQHIEDTGNRGRVGAMSEYYYLGNAYFAIRFDPAIIEINANDGSTPGNNGNKFNTAAAAPYTKLKVITDQNGTVDGHSTEAPTGMTVSNSMGCFLAITGNGAWTSTLYPSAGDGLDGYANLDWNIGYVSMRVKLAAVSGTGSAIHTSWDSATYFVGYDTAGTPYSASDDTPYDILYSANWPTWCEKLPGNGCNTGPLYLGQYNNERTYVCVQ